MWQPLTARLQKWRTVKDKTERSNSQDHNLNQAIAPAWEASHFLASFAGASYTVDGEDKPIFPTSPTKYFRDFGERYNIPGFHPHLLRHTSASLSLTNGGDIKSIADRLGHSDASVTLRLYAHANEESIRRAGQAARDALKRKKAEKQKSDADENCG